MSTPGRRARPVLLAASCALLLACGARSDLLSEEGGPGGTTTSSTSGGTGGTGGVGGGGAAPPTVPCTYLSAGDPVEILSYPNRSASSPHLVRVTDGTAGAARLALEVFASGGSTALHSVNEVASLRIGAAWPSEATIDVPPQAVGVESHTWAELARAPAGHERLALSWYSDPGMVGRLAFRPFELDSWSPGPVVDVDLSGSAALALVPGSGVGPMGVGYAGPGYGLVWRSHNPDALEEERPVVGVVGLDGTVLLGPHQIADFTTSAHRNPTALWSGAAYLVATAYESCLAGEAQCEASSVVITRLRPASGDVWDDSGLDWVTSLPVTEPGTRPGRPAMAGHGSRSWVAWTEGPTSNDGAPRRIRLAELSPAGEVTAGPATVVTEAQPLTRPTLSASDQGLALVWIEDSGDDGPPDQPGAAELVVLALDDDQQTLAPPLRIPITAAQPAYPAVVTLAAPRSLIVGWSGISQTGPLDVAHLARLDCVAAAAPAAGPQ